MSYFTLDSPVTLLLNYANQNISEQDKQNSSAKALYDLITHEENQDLRAFLSSFDVDPIPRKIDEREVFYKNFKKSPPTDIAKLQEYKDIFSKDLVFLIELNASYNDWREKIEGIEDTAEGEHIANACNYLKGVIDNEIYSIMSFMQNLTNVPKEIDSLEHQVNLDTIKEGHWANFYEAQAEFQDLLEFKTQKEGEVNAQKLQDIYDLQEERLDAHKKTLEETKDVLIRTEMKFKRKKNEDTQKDIEQLKKDIAEQNAIIVNEVSEQCETKLIQKKLAQKIAEHVKQGVI